MGKPIKNHFELKSVCRSAGLWYVGSFMIEMLMQRERWKNPATKTDFINYMFKNCGGAMIKMSLVQEPG